MAPVDLGDAVPTENLSDLPTVEDTIDVAREDEEANVPLAVPSPKEPGAAERARHELTHMPKKVGASAASQVSSAKSRRDGNREHLLSVRRLRATRPWAPWKGPTGPWGRCCAQ